MYGAGDGVAQNTRQAITYFQRGCELGNDQGCELRDRLSGN
jgi:TPR repeat protein